MSKEEREALELELVEMGVLIQQISQLTSRVHAAADNALRVLTEGSGNDK